MVPLIWWWRSQRIGPRRLRGRQLGSDASGHVAFRWWIRGRDYPTFVAKVIPPYLCKQAPTASHHHPASKLPPCTRVAYMRTNVTGPPRVLTRIRVSNALLRRPKGFLGSYLCAGWLPPGSGVARCYRARTSPLMGSHAASDGEGSFFVSVRPALRGRQDASSVVRAAAIRWRLDWRSQERYHAGHFLRGNVGSELIACHRIEL